jgi:hypothetical protein
MKKLFFFLFASMLLCSCKCVLSQIPPKYIYAGIDCTAPLPNYADSVTVKGGCSGVTLTQTPAAGTILTVVNKPENVILKATGGNGKSSQRSFTVTMIDATTPIIIPNPSFLVQFEPTQEMYNLSSCTTMTAAEFDAKFPYNSFGMVKPVAETTKIMIVYHFPGSATEKERWWTLR